jgi:hypothetical protein
VISITAGLRTSYWHFEDGYKGTSARPLGNTKTPSSTSNPATASSFFTDGITEATRSDGEEFGEAGILEAVRQGPPVPRGFESSASPSQRRCWKDKATKPLHSRPHPSPETVIS